MMEQEQVRVYTRNINLRFADLSLWKKFLAGAVSGAVGAFIANPTDVIKIRMQAEGPPRYKSFFHALGQIAREEGVASGLYKVYSVILMEFGQWFLGILLFCATCLFSYSISLCVPIRGGNQRRCVLACSPQHSSAATITASAL